MTKNQTLLQLSGADLKPAKIRDACLILIDLQNEYLAGPIAVSGAEEAINKAATLLRSARSNGTPIFHVAHRGKPGGLFDRRSERGQFVAALAPLPEEPIVEKTLPNAFAGTDLNTQLSKTGRQNLLLAGFMTHMCVSSTARAALDLGYRVTIVAEACATRDLPDGFGGTVPASVIHDVALIELSDRFAVIAHNCDDVL